ncbi:hypothetical protein LPU83_pLPU83c_0123 (plasmid) [Rhizobium favelukesii]|uniref:Uncharacterized protein n=1 Tax=Rhizobium favelukesii TaxID=348824 RepID=W6RK40_9HYPH|nr:hypothetical protein LPU83_pLPU83c_0123 [Rhizobium favelukesii]
MSSYLGGHRDSGFFGLPSPRQQFVDPARWMICDTGKKVGKPGLRIDLVHFCRDDHARGDETLRIRSAASTRLQAAVSARAGRLAGEIWPPQARPMRKPKAVSCIVPADAPKTAPNSGNAER